YRVRTDNGTEFKNKTLAKFFDEVGITQQFSTARTPKQNGVVERRNRTLVEATRTMLIFANLPLFLWAEAIATACFTQNRSIIHKRFDKTPYELMNKRKPNIKFFRVFGCRCYLLNDYEDVGKIKAKGDIGVFIGYSKESESSLSSLNDDVQQSSEEVGVPSSNTKSVSNNRVPNVDEANTSHNVFNESKALKDTDWVSAMQDELDQFARLKVWRLVPRPEGKTIIKTKWIFKNKKDESSLVIRNKARLVVVGYSQQEGIDYDETFAPVARIEATRLFLAYAAHKDFIPLDKALYGLKQAPRAWSDVLSHFLINSGFQKANLKYCIKFLDLMVKRFDMSMMGEMKFFLGLQVNQFSNGIFINQSKYIIDILKRFRMENSDTVPTPMVEQAKLKLNLVGKPVDHTDYQNMIGSLMCVTSSLWYPKDSGFDLTAYSDADQESTSGSVQFLSDKLVCWSSKKQNSVSISTTESEYVAVSSCCAKVLWMRTQLTDHGFFYDKNEHYALWEVIEFGDSYEAPPKESGTGLAGESTAKKKGRTIAITTKHMQKRRNDVKARTNLLLALPDEHQLRFSNADDAATSISHDTVCAYITSQSNGSQIKYEDINQIDEDDIKEIDIKWNMALLRVRPIRTKWVLKNKKDERGIMIRNKARLVAQGHTQEEGINYEEVFATVARIEAIRLFLAYAPFMGFTVYQMDVKSAFLYGTIDEEAFRAWYGTLSKYLLANGFQREFEALMHDKFQMSAMGELNFFLGLQVLQKKDVIFISQDKYVGDILKMFGYSDVRLANTPMDKENPWGKDKPGKDVELRLYRSMIGSLMYLTSSRPDIMFAVCACARHQVTPKECHLYAVKRIFKYLKGHPKLGLWYPKESLFDLVAYSDNDYGGATQDRKSTIGGCQFLGRRLISWQCKKQTIMATSTTKAEYVEAASAYDNVPDLLTKPFDVGRFQYLVFWSTARIETTNEGAKILTTIDDEPASLIRDDNQGETFPTVFGLEAGQDRDNIIKTSALPHDSTPRVTSLDADEGSMQQQLQELTNLCTRLQRQQTEMATKIEAQDLEISDLKARIKLLEDKDKGSAELSGDDAPIKGRRMDIGEEARVEKSTE
nr:putative ribonuclease H-like domain-containing protein [Tanacetum cinerariifolium]